MRMAEPFNANELIELLRGLEQRGIAYEVEYRRATDIVDGMACASYLAHRFGKSDSTKTI
jgi:hypothetical protein